MIAKHWSHPQFASVPAMDLVLDDARIVFPEFTQVIEDGYARDGHALRRIYLVAACGWTPEELDDWERLAWLPAELAAHKET